MKLESALILPAADKLFIEEITRSVIATYDSEEFEFEGSDDDIRKRFAASDPDCRFEMYLLSLLVTCKAMQQISLVEDDDSGAGVDSNGKSINLFSDFK